MEPTVNDVMTTPVVAVKRGASFKELASLLRKYRVSAFPVLDDDQKVIGVVSEADLLATQALNGDHGGVMTAMLHHREREKADGLTAGDLMTSNVVTVKPGDAVELAARLMYHLQVKRLPVVDAGSHLVGIVSRADLLTVFDRPDEEIRSEIVNDVILREFLIDPAVFMVTVADGVVTIQGNPETAGPADFDAVKATHEAMSPDNTYLRFFNLSRLAAETEARRICREPRHGHVALLALSAGEVVGCASYDALGEPADPGPVAEVAFAVADHMHHRGIATLLLEHLVSFARSHQITVFTAQTLAENTPMLKVFADAGLPVQRHYEDGVMEMTIPLPSEVGGTALDSYLNAVAEREGRAEVASLRHILAPESVVVIGASRRRGTVGRAILDNIITGGYAGRLYVVNPHARQVSGEHCLASVLDLPEPADLAVIAVPAAAVLDVAERCGQRGVRSLVVITAGLDTPGCADLLAVCRRHGMRLVGPDCIGVTVPAVGLDATFAARHPRPGVAGLVMQSGGLGIAVVDQLSRLGIGISSFASVGDKLDVSSNDMLMWWEHDGVTKLAVLYIESFGNPRKFARTARRVSAAMPVLTVAAGQQIATSHTAAVATPLVSREALFEQAGVITTPGLGDLVETTALLASQPLPAGRTVAIVSNVGGAGLLAADACAEAGLTVHRPHGLTSRRLRVLVPDTGAVGGPVDTTAAISAENFRQCLELLAADDEVDALIALVLSTAATGDLIAAIQQAQVRVPLAAVVLDQPESVRMLPCAEGEGQIPAYGYPEAAAAAMARAARYGAWRTEPRGQVPSLPDVRTEDARTLVREFFHATLGGGWMPADKAAELLRCYGIP
ncbi:MAG: GNAT family N-acetyltransferase, partial [Streptosporangiaceae bacterium]